MYALINLFKARYVKRDLYNLKTYTGSMATERSVAGRLQLLINEVSLFLQICQKGLYRQLKFSLG